MYTQRYYLFDYLTRATDRDEKIKEFEDFIALGLNEFVQYGEGLGIKIKVTDSDLRSVTNLGTIMGGGRGKNRDILVSLANTIAMSDKSHVPGWKEFFESSIFEVILRLSTSFQKMINLIRQYLSQLVTAGYEWYYVYYYESPDNRVSYERFLNPNEPDKRYTKDGKRKGGT